MATRDRTALFFRYREEAQLLHKRTPSNFGQEAHDSTQQEDRVHLLNEDDDSDEDGASSSRNVKRMGGMEPDWVFAYNDLKGDLNETEKMLEQLAALYARHLLPSFGEKDTSELEQEIRARSHRLTELLHAIEHKVRHISKRDDGHWNEERDVEAEIRRNMQKRFATPLQQLSLSFRKRQNAYLDKLRELRESYSVVENSVAVSPVDIPPSNAPKENAFGTHFSETQLLTVENASNLTEERTRELNRVAANINDLATIVKDIASLVVDQGTVLDRIDYNLEEVKLTTFEAVRELRITDRNERKRHALCVIIVLSVACAIMFILLIFKWTA